MNDPFQRIRQIVGYRDAIASIESAGSGDYRAVGPTHPELGRALGRYQVMEANVGPWSRNALGYEVTPEQFLANDDIQDAIFDAQFGGYVNQFGPEGAAQAWFGGPGGVGKLDRQDSLGTSIGQYTDKFRNALGDGPTQARADAGMPLNTRTPPGQQNELDRLMRARMVMSMMPQQRNLLNVEDFTV